MAILIPRYLEIKDEHAPIDSEWCRCGMALADCDAQYLLEIADALAEENKRFYVAAQAVRRVGRALREATEEPTEPPRLPWWRVHEPRMLLLYTTAIAVVAFAVYMSSRGA